MQIVYERALRPPEKRHEPWVARVTAQPLAAYDLLESDLARAALPAARGTIDQAGVTVATAWYFTQQVLADVVGAANHPALRAHSAQAEALHEFAAAPHGPDTCRA